MALTPDRLQGRVQAASTLISFSAGAAGGGLLLEHAGTTATILALSGWAALLAIGATASRSFRHPPELPAAALLAPAVGRLITTLR